MAERSKAHAWKACVGQPTVGSNPTLSARFMRRMASREWLRGGRRRSTAGFRESIPTRGFGFRFEPDAQESCAPVAQLDRASACGAEGRTFESCRARHSCRGPYRRDGLQIIPGTWLTLSRARRRLINPADSRGARRAPDSPSRSRPRSAGSRSDRVSRRMRRGGVHARDRRRVRFRDERWSRSPRPKTT